MVPVLINVYRGFLLKVPKPPLFFKKTFFDFFNRKSGGFWYFMSIISLTHAFLEYHLSGPSIFQEKRRIGIYIYRENYVYNLLTTLEGLINGLYKNLTKTEQTSR